MIGPIRRPDGRWLRRRTRLILTAALPAALALVLVPAVTAHAPDPVFTGSLYAQDQELRFRWKSGQVPPAAMQTAIKAAAADSNATRLSRAAVFAYAVDGTSWINYGSDVSCGVSGIACFSRSGAPTSFTMSFREQGYRFDWGTLKWCQLYTNAPDGCFDVENVALDEFGHVEILNHHVNYADNRDYLDAVVQTVSRAKPKTGWNVHAYGRCDVASLQRKYNVQSWLTKYSTCLSVATNLTLTPSATWLTYGASVTFTASLSVTDESVNDRLRKNPISSRTVVLQRRPVGGSTWTTIATMPPGSTAGGYVYTASSQTTSAEWRAIFAKPSDEGLRASTSPTTTVSVSSCRTAPCPQ